MRIRLAPYGPPARGATTRLDARRREAVGRREYAHGEAARPEGGQPGSAEAPSAAAAGRPGVEPSRAEQERRERREEVSRYVERLDEFGLSLTELTRRAPKNPVTRGMIKELVSQVAADPVLHRYLLTHRTLPRNASNETEAAAIALLERHRPYVIALSLISRTEFPHLYAYLGSG